MKKFKEIFESQYQIPSESFKKSKRKESENYKKIHNDPNSFFNKSLDNMI